MHALRASRYNITFDVEDGTHVAFNAFSGAFARIQPEDINRFEGLLRDPASFSVNSDNDRILLEHAKRARFVIDENVDELDLVRLQMNLRKFTSEHFHLTILPTLECNFSCPYCYEVRGTGKMTPEDQDRLCGWVQEKVRSARLMSVGWFGGEPLVAWDVMKSLSARFISYCSERDVKYRASITTNGYFLVKKVIQNLTDCGVDCLQVTLDGPAEIHDQRRRLKNGKGTFQALIRNLTNVCQAIPNIRLTIRVNVDAVSYDRIPELLPLLPAVIKDQCEIYFRQVFPPPQWWD